MLMVHCCVSPVSYSEKLATQAQASRPPQYTAGVTAYRQGDYAKALEAFRQVLLKDTANVNAHYYQALSKERLGQTVAALPDYQYVVQHGREGAIVNYAQVRLETIQSNVTPKVADVAFIASGTPAMPVIYRGVASQVAVPLKNSKNALVVDAFVHHAGTQVDGVFIIDTGATYTSISRDMAEQLGLDLTHCETVFITTANGRIEVPKVTLEKLNVNGLEAYNVEATVIPLRKESSFAGLLGLSFIRQFVLTIDPQANQLIFRKN